MPEGLTPEAEKTVKTLQAHIDTNLKALASRIETSDQIEANVKQMLIDNGVDKDSIKSITDTLRKQGEAIKNQGTPAQRIKSMPEQVEEAVKSQSYIEAMDAKRPYSIEIKSADSMLVSGNRDAVTAMTATVDPTVQAAPLHETTLLSRVMGITAQSDTIKWVDRTPKDGGAAFTAEGAAIPIADWEYTVESSVAKKVAVMGKLSYEMRTDVGFISNEIAGLQRELVTTEAENNLLTGSGTGANLKGITSVAVDYTATALSEKVYAANYADAIFAAAAQLKAGAFKPDLVFVHPNDAALINLTKSTIGTYIGADLMKLLATIEVVENINISEGSFLLMDSSVWKVLPYGNMEVEFGYDTDDFSKDMISLKTRMRLHSYVPTVKKNGILYSSFADVLDVISIPEPVEEETDSNAE